MSQRHILRKARPIRRRSVLRHHAADSPDAPQTGAASVLPSSPALPPHPDASSSAPPPSNNPSALPPQRETSSSLPPQRETSSSLPPHRETSSSLPPHRGDSSQPRATPWVTPPPISSSPARATQPMTLQTFFEKFDLFADAPNAVAKMRELVLELAVQGKLVDQKNADGSAVKLLADISSERDERAEFLRTPKEPALSNGSENAFQIPSTWVWAKLGNIALQIQYGYTASADHNSTDVRMLRITDIQNNRVNWPSVPGCQITAAEAEKYLLIPNDILIARTGGTIGKSFIIPDAPVRSVFASYLIRVTPPSSMEARFLKIFLESPLYWTQLQAMSAGTGQPNVNGQALGRLKLPLPPLAEQKRIVAKVDELMALCDRLEAQQQEREEKHAALARASLARFAAASTPANLNFLFHNSFDIVPADLRKAILAMAVRGKLLPQNPQDEPASKLLKRIDLLKREAATTGRTRSTENRDSTLCAPAPFEIPSTWIWTELSNLGQTSTGKTPPTGNPEFFSGNIPFIGPGQIRPSGEMIETEKFISELGISSSTEAKPGDILMVCIGGSIGKSAIVKERLAFNQQLNLISPIEVETGYLFSVLNAEYFYERVISSSSGSATPIINRSKWNSILVPLPPLAEQRRIVAKVDQLMSLVDQLETQLAASRATAKNLLEAVVTELTRQSPPPEWGRLPFFAPTTNLPPCALTDSSSKTSRALRIACSISPKAGVPRC